jgi:hypothetical protein
MLKPMFGLAATGFVAFFLWKLLAAFVLPLIGVAVVAVLVLVKLIFIVLSVLLLIWVYKRLNRSESTA